MELMITPESHVDHGMSEFQRAFAMDRLREKDLTGFKIYSFELPLALGTVPCALLGPLTGMTPVSEDLVFYAKRGNRPNDSRLIRKAPIPSRIMTAIVIDGVLVTLYGGPLACQEPTDPFLPAEKLEGSKKFWREHALSAEAFGL